ncbi:hypothetical protein DMO24_19180 [Modestobacter versicolor]|uniref:Uncharacterized protein n=1 Tax=Modestobacter versicolor TaxID=429133 RepID=A0A323V519_9ACTN|nr:hypothetical protein DMO24_19180 [Modestobacter versicolor]
MASVSAGRARWTTSPRATCVDSRIVRRASTCSGVSWSAGVRRSTSNSATVIPGGRWAATVSWKDGGRSSAERAKTGATGTPFSSSTVPSGPALSGGA